MGKFHRNHNNDMSPDHVNYKVSPILTRKAESIISARLQAAQDEYAEKSLYLRKNIGVYLKCIRTRAKVSHNTMAKWIGLPLKSAHGVLTVVEMPTIKKSYGVERLLELATLYEKALADHANDPPVPRGRKRISNPASSRPAS